MENINRMIEAEQARAIEHMKTLKPEDPNYKTAAEAIATLQRARLEEERLEFEDRKNGDELILREEEQKQAEANAKLERKRFRIRACLDAAGILVPAALYTFFGVKGFKFEETGSFCSTTHRQNFANLFKFRK